jgi:hypothetical protein
MARREVCRAGRSSSTRPDRRPHFIGSPSMPTPRAPRLPRPSTSTMTTPTSWWSRATTR